MSQGNRQGGSHLAAEEGNHAAEEGNRAAVAGTLAAEGIPEVGILAGEDIPAAEGIPEVGILAGEGIPAAAGTRDHRQRRASGWT